MRYQKMRTCVLGKGAQLKQKCRDGEILVLWEQISLAITERSCQRNYRQRMGLCGLCCREFNHLGDG